jgi:hypothetical protein
MVPVVRIRGVAASHTQYQLGSLICLLFGPLKWNLSEQRFVNDDAIAAMMTWLQMLDHYFL